MVFLPASYFLCYQFLMNTPTLYIFSGLPASGKTTIARELAKHTNAVLLRIDTVEQGLKDICNLKNIEGKGYRLSYLIAKDNLTAGNDVIADSVNPWELTRKEWNDVAISVGAKYMNIEIICSDKSEHESRVKNRDVGIQNLKPPTWKDILNRDYHDWKTPRIAIDTAGKKITESIGELMLELETSS